MNRRFFLTRLGAAATAIGWPFPTKPRQRHDLRAQEALHYARVDDGWIRLLDWPVPHASTLTNAWRDMEVMESSAGRPLTEDERAFLLAIPPVDAQAQTCA